MRTAVGHANQGRPLWPAFFLSAVPVSLGPGHLASGRLPPRPHLRGTGHPRGFMTTQVQDLSATHSRAWSAKRPPASFRFIPRDALDGLCVASRALSSRPTMRWQTKARCGRAHGRPDEAPIIVGRDPSTDIALLRIDRVGSGSGSVCAGVPATGSLALLVGVEEGGPTAALGVVSLSAGGPGEPARRRDRRAHRARCAPAAAAPKAGSRSMPARPSSAWRCSGRDVGCLSSRRRPSSAWPPGSRRTAGSPRGYLGLGLHPVAVNGGGAARWS